MANIGQTMFRFCGALLLAAGATIIDHRLLRTMSEEVRVATVPVVVAATNIPEGVVIDPSALTTAQWPAQVQPPGAFDRVEMVSGRVSRVPIYKGEAIVPGRLARPGVTAGLEVKIGPGKRAYGLRVDDAATFAGLIRPNSRVDVIVVGADPAHPGRSVADVVLSDARVLAIGVFPQRASDGRQVRAGHVSLEVTPDEAELLATATLEGQVQLVLRGRNDRDSVRTVVREIRSAAPRP